MILKIGKTTPGVQNNSQVVYTPESLDCPVMNTPGVDVLVYMEPASEQVKKNFLVTDRPGSQDSLVNLSLVYFSPAGFFVNQFR
jgi:hypothetical protein